MDFALPEHLPGLLADMDDFIEREIAPLQAENMQYFDQRREHARTDWDNDGIPTAEWEDLLIEMRRRADRAGWLRYALPASLGGRDGTNVAELGIGTNEEAILIGNILEDEKILGTAHVAFGASAAIGGTVQVPIHLDCVVLEPTVEIDGEALVSAGELLV